VHAYTKLVVFLLVELFCSCTSNCK